ncbi:MAG: Trp family transcriptional regulator [bacterium]|nr:Trp family transcriptional regulator [bacterium]
MHIPKESPKNLSGKSAIQWSEKLWDELLEKLAKIDSKDILKDVLEKLISNNEKDMILRRLAVAALIRDGKSYREISEALWLSHPTISTIKKNVLGDSKNYKSYRSFYGRPTKWSNDSKIRKETNDEFINIINDISMLIDKISKTSGLGILSSQDAQAYRKRVRGANK